MDNINKKYENLCAEYRIPLKILTVCDKELPISTFQENTETNTLILNKDKIDKSGLEYESVIAYQVGKILLPRLNTETERLIIRRFSPSDSKTFFLMASDYEGCYMDCSNVFTSMDEDFKNLMSYFEKQEMRYVLVLKDTNEVIGTVVFLENNTRAVDTFEIGYIISPFYRRKGYAYEAISCLLDLIQGKLQTDMIIGGVLEENIPSANLLKKLGFKKEGIHHKATWHEMLGKPVDLVYYYRDKDDHQF